MTFEKTRMIQHQLRPGHVRKCHSKMSPETWRAADLDGIDLVSLND